MAAIAAGAASLAGWAQGTGAASNYRNDFSQDEVGKPPQGLLVLDGGFAVQQEAGNKFLELPGSPLETYGVLFGPAEKDGTPSAARPESAGDTATLSVTGRFFGTGKGRRFPTFAIGMGGVGGYRLQVSPGKKEIEIFRGESDKASVPFAWPAGEWIWLKLQVRPLKPGEWRVEGKAWKDGDPQPAEWTIAWTDAETPKPGRPSVWGCPFAGTPIRFDDLSWERTP